MSVLYPLIQALVLFAVAPLLPVLPAWREPAYITVVGRVCCRSIVTLSNCWAARALARMPPAGCPPDAVCDGGRHADYRYCAAGGDRRFSAAATGRFDHLTVSLCHRAFLLAISGLDTDSPFTAIGASREAMLGVLVEPMLLLGLWVAAQVAGSTNISNITDTVYHWPLSQSIPLVLALCACAFATFIEMGKLPFDLAEAEQELQEGPLSSTAAAALAS